MLLSAEEAEECRLAKERGKNLRFRGKGEEIKKKKKFPALGGTKPATP